MNDKIVSHNIKIIMRGKDDDSLHLNDLLYELNRINNTLNQIDQKLTKSIHPTLLYRIVTLRKESPATIEIEPIPKSHKENFSDTVPAVFFNGFVSLTSGEIPDTFDWNILNAYSAIGKRLNDKLENISIHYQGQDILLRTGLEDKIKELMGEDQIEEGFVSGILESLNIHRGRNKFVIYPVVGASKIDCSIPVDLVPIAINAVDKYLKLTGEVKYKKFSKYPHAINVKEIEVFPDEDELPTMYDLQGLAPAAQLANSNG